MRRRPAHEGHVPKDQPLKIWETWKRSRSADRAGRSWGGQPHAFRRRRGWAVSCAASLHGGVRRGDGGREIDRTSRARYRRHCPSLLAGEGGEPSRPVVFPCTASRPEPISGASPSPSEANRLRFTRSRGRCCESGGASRLLLFERLARQQAPPTRRRTFAIHTACWGARIATWRWLASAALARQCPRNTRP